MIRRIKPVSVLLTTHQSTEKCKAMLAQIYKAQGSNLVECLSQVLGDIDLANDALLDAQ